MTNLSIASNRSSILSDLNVSGISDHGFAMEEKRNPLKRPQSALSTTGRAKRALEDMEQDEILSIKSIRSPTRPTSAVPKVASSRLLAENSKDSIHITNRIDTDLLSEPVSSRSSRRSVHSSMSVRHEDEKEPKQQSYFYTIAKKAPIVERPGSSPLFKRGRGDVRSKTSSELYDENFDKMVKKDESNQAISNQWHQMLSENKQPLIHTVLHNYEGSRPSSSASNRGEKQKTDFIKKNMEAIHEIASAKSPKNNVTSRPRSFILDSSIGHDTSYYDNPSIPFEHEELRKSHSTLLRKFSRRQGVPRSVNSRTVFNPNNSYSKNSEMSFKNRPQSAMSQIRYSTTPRHVDVVTEATGVIRPKSALNTKYTKKQKETLSARPTTEEPFKKAAFLNVQGFSINSTKIVHEGHYEDNRKLQRGAPRPSPPDHCVVLAKHNSRFSIEN
ncbi:hypothetical protein FDP41_010508 [Naegleria fowleri]|uniref:Uncharacterized protein n=1 Tax=Naegleria fowleri TaxID=5763 RepID=A0A6A5BZ71_NAEFO|nr:uncharacterized protein FDP41_010508 [Naegleria fowleri]KAF0983443.1 hypothetical protein FDP41_010508 [Naegleria fowleri]CAG4713231.1 unnamed protein product [Naegleria fowleri]